MYPPLLPLFLVLSLTALPACAATAHDDEAGVLLDAEVLSGLELRGLGPALMSGRIADIAIHPQRRSTWYVGVGSGGVWKTVNAGTTWESIFDEQPSYSIGCVALDPSTPETVWVGTGENVSGRHVGFGDGLYRSRDGGKTWQARGLAESQHIGSISIDPRDGNTIVVAAQGPLWSAGGERGLYRSTDGGDTWTLVLAGGEYTGANEVLRHPANPDILFAAMQQRFRNVAALINGGPESGIHKSTDGGVTWREVTEGLPEEDMGRIGLAVSHHDPDVVFATIELAGRKGGFYRSTDCGESWAKRNDYISGGTGPHYYQEIWASPHHEGRVYQADVWLHVTEDGGESFEEVGEAHKHSDNHALAFHDDPDYMLVGCDGGLYETFDQGATWKFVDNLPVTQFYKLALDDAEPFYNVYGGTQDNNSQAGPVRSDSAGGIRNADWFITLGGDGHDQATEPGNPDIVYVEWQEGHLNRYDRTTGETIDIQPQPRAGEESERYNWDAPILVSPHSPTRVYFASQRVWCSEDRGDSWTPISGDLTSGTNRLTEPMMGRVWSVDAVWDLWAMSKYATITSLAESPLVEGLLYAGTDDGRSAVTEDGGSSWRTTTELPQVPDGWFVNDLKADLFDADTAYVCVDQHKRGDFRPFVLKTTDRGRSWSSISGDLPERHLVWRLEQDHVRPELLFLGTEFGLFFSVDGGERWVELEGGVPNIPFRDLAIQRRESDLVGATFGRGFWVLDDYAPLRELSEELLSREAHLFDVRDAWSYVPREPLGDAGPASQGDSYFIADNPPFGAVFTYYLRDGFEKLEDARRAAEKERAEEGQDNPTPGWGALEAEASELEPGVVFTVRDSGGGIVARVPGAAGKGLHRVAWDLRYPSVTPWSEEDEREPWEPPDSGFLAMPGEYTVSMARLHDGELVDLGQVESFVVKALRRGAIPAVAPESMTALHREHERVARKAAAVGRVLGEQTRSIDALLETLLRSGVEDDLYARARATRAHLLELSLRVNGSRRRDFAGDPGPVSLRARLGFLSNLRFSTHGPTQQHRDVLLLAAGDLAAIQADLVDVTSELDALGALLDEAGVPWSPGRGAGR